MEAAFHSAQMILGTFFHSTQMSESICAAFHSTQMILGKFHDVC